MNHNNAGDRQFFGIHCIETWNMDVKFMYTHLYKSSVCNCQSVRVELQPSSFSTSLYHPQCVCIYQLNFTYWRVHLQIKLWTVYVCYYYTCIDMWAAISNVNHQTIVFFKWLVGTVSLLFGINIVNVEMLDFKEDISNVWHILFPKRLFQILLSYYHQHIWKYLPIKILRE